MNSFANFKSSCKLSIDVPIVMKDIDEIETLQRKLEEYERTNQDFKFNELESYISILKQYSKIFLLG